MLKSCDMPETDHNTNTLQPESLPLTISADGRYRAADKGIRQQAADGSLEFLEIIIDANQLLGGGKHTLLGDETTYLPCSAEFILEHFEPRPDGTCLARYKRRDKESEPNPSQATISPS